MAERLLPMNMLLHLCNSHKRYCVLYVARRNQIYLDMRNCEYIIPTTDSARKILWRVVNLDTLKRFRIINSLFQNSPTTPESFV